ncbi:MAG TPA: hypothetical protein GXX55_03550 [Firmicutes bacterium]|nr:hypothetical protein [Bacillota bacterium]
METVLKVDPQLRIVYGWVALTRFNGQPYVDLQGDVVEAESLQKALRDFMLKGANAGVMHARDESGRPVVVGKVVEALLLTDEKLEVMFPGNVDLPDSPRGLFVGIHIQDDRVWEKIKRGELRGFSLAGKGVRREV